MYSYIFDIGGVLLNFDYKNIIETLSQKTNCETDKIGDLLFKKEYIYPVETGKITGKEFFIGFVQQIMPQLTYEEWILHHIDNCTVNKSGIDLLLELRTGKDDIFSVIWPSITKLHGKNHTPIFLKFAVRISFLILWDVINRKRNIFEGLQWNRERGRSMRFL